MALKAIVTRAAEQAGPLARGLEELGLEVILSPAIKFTEPGDWGPFDRAVGDASSWNWMILTSANGVRAVSARLAFLGSGWGSFSQARLAAIGPATGRALSKEGITADLVPEEFRAEGILEAFGTASLEGTRVLLARAEIAREVLPDELRRRGALVEVAPVYRTLACPPATEAVEALREPQTGQLLVIFTSPSTVNHFLDGLPADVASRLRQATIASIGPVTTDALKARGLKPALEPPSYTVPALLEELRSHARLS